MKFSWGSSRESHKIINYLINFCPASRKGQQQQCAILFSPFLCFSQSDFGAKTDLSNFVLAPQANLLCQFDNELIFPHDLPIDVCDWVFY